jgi:hypothetical protein
MTPARYQYRDLSPHTSELIAELNKLGAEGWHVVATFVGTSSSGMMNATGFTETSLLLLEREVPPN